DDEEIEVAVVVEIQPCDAAAVRIDDEILRDVAADIEQCDARFRRDVDELHGEVRSARASGHAGGAQHDGGGPQVPGAARFLQLSRQSRTQHPAIPARCQLRYTFFADAPQA